MNHLPGIIQDLALILIAGSFVTILFKAIRQPVVLGYILAGLILSPHVPILPSIKEVPPIQEWGEIGIIFLLFALGLEFSFKRLLRVGGSASITAVVEVVIMILLGFLTGHLLGWRLMDSIFLGGVLAISSTTIIIRAFDELGVKGRGFVHLVFGVLIVEDLVAVLLLALLSTIAVTRQFVGAELFYSLLKLSFFLTIWFLSGVFLIPTFLKRAGHFLNEETLLIVSLGLCFVMVVFATQAGFSPALGAFMMGSILAETREAERIEHLVRPVKDLFAAVFFVSVGMMLDPEKILEHAGPIAIITIVAVAGKILSTMTGALLSGESLKRSVQSGFSLAQIGEFSFIIAGLGQSLGVTSSSLYPIAVGVSAITTFTTPYLIKSSDRAHRFLESRLPPSWLHSLAEYTASTQQVSEIGEVRKMLRRYVLRMVALGSLITAIFVGVSAKGLPLLLERIDSPLFVRILGLALALALSSPFIFALILAVPQKERLQELVQQRNMRTPVILMEIVRIVMGLGLVGALTTQFLPPSLSLAFTLIAMVTAMVLSSRFLIPAYRWMERGLIENLNDRDAQTKPVTKLAPWDAHITTLDMAPESIEAGRTLEELRVRERFGVTIALIERGSRRITAPSRNERLLPRDRIAVIGTDDQIMRFREILSAGDLGAEAQSPGDYGLHRLRISAESDFVNKTIRDSGIREKTHGLVVGLERNNQRILNPDSMSRIELGDVLWIVGDQRRMQNL